VGFPDLSSRQYKTPSPKRNESVFLKRRLAN
jgi:hypothetical protein